MFHVNLQGSMKNVQFLINHQWLLIITFLISNEFIQLFPVFLSEIEWFTFILIWLIIPGEI